ncbi:MAG: SDR family oxidoreductase [Proteobacteria bacterium]|nr:SDR family oxidoreductase [Pseudomonadota bacterium]
MTDTSQFELQGKTALITGGSRGIGEATAIAFAKAGADVALTSRKLPDLERVAAEVEKLGRRALAVDCHVGRMDQLQPLVDKVTAEFGKIDILVNNAGTSLYSTCLDLSEKAWDAVMNLNLKGLFFLSQAAVRVMKEHGGGSIINVSSVAGTKGDPATPHYSISKAAVNMATRIMGQDWAKYDVRVNCIAPGMIQTRMYDALFANVPEDQVEDAKELAHTRVAMGRAGEPTEIADVMVFLASQASSYMTGQTLVVDGALG